MLQALLIGILTAVILALVAVSVLKIIDARAERDNVKAKKDFKEVGAKQVVATKRSVDGAEVGGSKNAKANTSKLTKRIIGFGAFAGGIFVLLAGKLASMQLFGSSSYSKQANDNQYRTVNAPAARGMVTDRNGRTLVYSQNVSAVVAEKDVADDSDTMRILSAVLGIPYGIVRKRILDSTSGAQSRRVVSETASDRDISWILEHKDKLPGVFVENRTVRKYTYGALAGHVLGYTGYPSEEEVANSQDNSLSLDVANGKSGIEAQYNSLLSGDAGQRMVRVDADGNIVEVKNEIAAVRGSDLELTLDAHAQYTADKMLREKALDGKCSTGAVVCLDLATGGIVAMSSFPTFDPNRFTGGIPDEIWGLYSDENSRSPMLNRAISSTYAPGSTMKSMSAIAGLKYGLATTEETFNCTGYWDGFGEDDIQKCWNLSGHGNISLHTGIVVSCDVVFYEIAKRFFQHSSQGTGDISDTALQGVYESFGLGTKTGVDLSDEVAGRIPTPEWKKERWRNVPSNGNWTGGDYTNMIIGQGDVLVTPLQLACAYSTVATGKTMKPHLVKAIKNSEGDTVVETQLETLIQPELNESDIKFVREALHDMVTGDTNVTKVCNELGVDAAGKTGTAEHANEIPDTLFVGYAPYDDPKYVCACVLQHGNSATLDSAPIVINVLNAAIAGETDATLEVGAIAGYAGEELITGENEGASLGARGN